MLSTIGGAIAWIAGLVVLYKLFQKEGLVKAILGLICMLYTFVWGWQNISKTELNLKNWMYIWTGAIILGIILGIIGAATAGGATS